MSFLKKIKNKFTTEPKITYVPTTWTVGTDHGCTITISHEAEIIMSLFSSGEIKWHKDNIEDKAVQIFLDSLSFQIEDRAGIKETRKEWEERIMKKVYRATKQLKTQTLTPEQVRDIIKREIMFDRLAGK